MLRLLPDALCLEIVAVWLDCDLAVVGALDSAFCSKNDRSMVLNVLAKTIEMSESTADMRVSYLNWIGVRNFRLKVIVLSGMSLLCNYQEQNVFSRITTSTVTSLTLHNCVSVQIAFGPDDMVRLINSCPNLTSLEVDSVFCFTDSVIRKINTQILNQLTYLSFSECTARFSVLSLAYLSEQCTNLTDLHCHFSYRNAHLYAQRNGVSIAFCDEDYRALPLTHYGMFAITHLIPLVKVNPKLNALSITHFVVTDALLVAVAESCPAFNSLVVEDGNVIETTLTGVANFINAYKGSMLEIHICEQDDFERSLKYSNKHLTIRLDVGCREPDEEKEDYRQLNSFFEIATVGLTAVELSGMSHDTALTQILHAMVANNPQLESLSLRDVKHIPTVTMRNVLLSCANLSTLELLHVSLEAVQALMTTPNSSITELVLASNDYEITTDMVITIIQNCSALATIVPRGFATGKCIALLEFINSSGRDITLSTLSPRYQAN